MKDRERDRKKRKGHIQKERWRDVLTNRQMEAEREKEKETERYKKGLLFI